MFGNRASKPAVLKVKGLVSPESDELSSDMFCFRSLYLCSRDDALCLNVHRDLRAKPSGFMLGQKKYGQG